jgi:hypothetical protein
MKPMKRAVWLLLAALGTVLLPVLPAQGRPMPDGARCGSMIANACSDADTPPCHEQPARETPCPPRSRWSRGSTISPRRASRGRNRRPCPRRDCWADRVIPLTKPNSKTHIMKNSRIALVLLTLAALAATGFSAKSSATKAKDACPAETACCCDCDKGCGEACTK